MRFAMGALYVHNYIITLMTGLENLYVIFLNTDFSFNSASISVKFLGDVLYDILDGLACLKVLIQVLVIFLYYVEVLENNLFIIIFFLCQNNVTRT